MDQMMVRVPSWVNTTGCMYCDALLYIIVKWEPAGTVLQFAPSGLSNICTSYKN